MPAKKRDSDSSNDDEGDRHKDEEIFERQDLYVVFTHERELRNIDQVKIKISQFTGVVMRCKQISYQSMDNLLSAIEADALVFQENQKQIGHLPIPKRAHPAPNEMGGLPDQAPQGFQTPMSGIVNLRFEECTFATKAVQVLKNFLSQKQLIETFTIQKVEFQEPISDFRAMMEGLQYSIKIRKVGILGQVFDEEAYGKILNHTLNDCRQMKEFDASGSEFLHPKCFFDMCQAFIADKCRVSILKLKNIQITNLEGKVLQFVLMKNKSLHTLDLSNAKVESGECLEFFLQKLDKHSNIRYLVMDSIQPDLSSSLEILGEAIAENTKIEVLIMRENKLKWVPYAAFWENMKKNTSLIKINVSKTDLSDRVLEKLSVYLINPSLRLVDLDISRNQITDVGLTNLSEALINNSQIKFLNLGQNMIRDAGLRTLVNYLSLPTCTLIELSLMGNKINNEGIQILSEFIKPNNTLKMLDISKNAYGDNAFTNFAQEMGVHATLTFLDISKSKELNDEGSLITLAKQLAFNIHLQTLDLTGVRVRKPFLKMYMEPSLNKNITLKYVLGKLTPDIIDEQLNINIQIQTDVETNYQKVCKPHKNYFDVSLVDPECNSRLDMKDKLSTFFDATFKFMHQVDVRQVDLTNMGIQDGQLYQLANYLQQVPNLRSLILNGNNQISDDGVQRLATSLSHNNKLAHLSIIDCKALGNESLIQLNKVITEDNMMLCSIEFDESQFDNELGKLVKRECTLNRHIQENLKPQFIYSNKGLKRPKSAETNVSNQLKIGDKKPISEEVRFDETAEVSKYLTAAIKCWRISLPIIIQIENQQLTDKHVQELCEFLKGRNVVLNLNLRRNRITNQGALVLIDFMLNHDEALTHLDISRNRITRAGAVAFLAAIKKLTRIIDLQITYGNPIPLDISLAITQEVVANNQIKANQQDSRQTSPNSKVTLSSCKYELIDRGPNYMRCAIKSVELLKITHLSLPDNMLGLEEAKMLAAMIKMDPPLKILNLEQNNLDNQCAKLLGDALQSNSNLQVLNISKNKLSDLGINFLLQSQIKSKLTQLKEVRSNQKKIVSAEVLTPSTKQSEPPQGSPMPPARKLSQSPTPTLSPKSVPRQTTLNLSPIFIAPRSKHPVRANSSNSQVQEVDINHQTEIPESERQMLSEEIEKCEMGQLKILNIIDNMSTVESYKSIWTLLQVNPNIVLYFDSPVQLKYQQQQQALLLLQSVKYQKIKKQNSELVDQSDQNLMMEIDEPDLESSQQQDNQNSDEEEEEEESVVIVHQNNATVTKIIRFHAVYMERFTKVCKVVLCFNQPLTLASINRDKASLRVILTWRLLQWKQSVTAFQANPESLAQFDRPSIQNTISVLILANQGALYLFTILPFMTGEQMAGVSLACFIGYLLMFETMTVLVARSSLQVQAFNPYLWLQILSGLLQKAGILGLGLIGGISAQGQKTLGGQVIAAIALFAVIIDQYKPVIALKNLRKIDESSMLPMIERSQKIAELFNYQGLLIVYKKITLLPSRQSEILSQKIAVDLNPDLMKAPAVGFIAKTIEAIQALYHASALARHLVLIDITLLSVWVISIACQWAPLNNFTIATLIVLFVDGLSCILQLTEKETVISLNQDLVFAMASERLRQKAERYNDVLMKESVTPLLQEELMLSEEESFIEADEIDFGVPEGQDQELINKSDQDLSMTMKNNQANTILLPDVDLQEKETILMLD